MFSGSELEDFGSDVWKEFWEATRNHPVSTAYKEAEYPNVANGSRCVLCHQTLTQETKERLVSFENFVKGEMQKAALDAAREYETASQTIEALPTPEALEMRIGATGISQDKFASQVTDFFALLRARKDQFPKIDFEEANVQSNSLGEAIEQNEIDALLLAGDIFDTSTPSNRTQELDYRFLCQGGGQSQNNLRQTPSRHGGHQQVGQTGATIVSRS